ncbi:carbohydrate-binding module family 20 domain-containing protein [Phytomonospora sp. NPDC050363]|uniref:carbohydrate-binding module family 20 domain-containing protein n=1 Tax=Phytomonospora sp. NPDC050363 TaxID=3155642 RepID=UPI0033DA9C33
MRTRQIPTFHRRPLRTFAAAAVIAAAALIPGGTATEPAAADIAVTAAPGNGDAVLHLFAWPWKSVAAECTNVLGPAGFPAVEVAAPQEHVVLPARAYPWWQDYQPVSYQLNTRRGSTADFAAMVDACDAAGVEVYIDAVVNHMAGGASTGDGSGGNAYTQYSYPAVPFGPGDFHHCGRNGNDDIANWTDRWEVQNCELLDLSDLETESDYVRGKLAAYLQNLVDLGVDGFRVDAAKHVPVADLQNIFGRLSGGPKIFLEVIEGGAGEISPTEYTGLGRVTEFRYGDQVGARFKDGDLAALSGLESHLLLGSAAAETFIDNHDTQRSGRAQLTYKDGARYIMAEAFALAHGYGSPQLLSGYAFTDPEAGPPSTSDGTTTPALTASGACATGWECSHRQRAVLNLGALREAAAGQATTHWWSNGSNQIAFGRASKAHAAFNASGASLTRAFATGLPDGVYCDVANGDYKPADRSCTGPSYRVTGGSYTGTVPANGVLALHANAMTQGDPGPGPGTCASGVQVTFSATATTVWGQNVYVTGSIPQLANWSAQNAVPLTTDAATYPLWTSAALTLPVGTAFQYKYVKRHNGAVVWESDPNRSHTVTASSGCAITLRDTWR